jgi:hypothetical protein
MTRGIDVVDGVLAIIYMAVLAFLQWSRGDGARGMGV